ncbi:MAG: hypothetical protein Q9M10_00540, partial [Mariprofundaceae bacterium]|nr:hypothetical protein [Mariprofundaceae bacterium]
AVGNIPSVWLLNKVDLTDAWCISDAQVSALQVQYHDVYRSSAKTGEHVESSFLTLVENMLHSS